MGETPQTNLINYNVQHITEYIGCKGDSVRRQKATRNHS